MTSVYISGKIIQDIRKFYRICNRIRSMCGLTECGCFYPLEQLSVNNHIYSLNIHKFSEILEDAANSWESEVDMVLARIPARISPAISTARNP